MITAKIDALKMSRLECGWNLVDLARESDVNKATIARIEHGTSTSPATAKRVADALGKPIAELFSIE